jgi:hypothetical protein
MTRLSKRGFIEGRPKSFDDPIIFQACVDEYFMACEDQKEIIKNDKGHTRIIHKPYTITGLCLHLNISKETFNQYSDDPMFSESIKEAKMRCENWTEEKALTGEINPTAAIFNLKNNYGWVDRREIETADVTKEKYESWLKENQEALRNVTPENKQISENIEPA